MNAKRATNEKPKTKRQNVKQMNEEKDLSGRMQNRIIIWYERVFIIGKNHSKALEAVAQRIKAERAEGDRKAAQHEAVDHKVAAYKRKMARIKAMEKRREESRKKRWKESVMAFGKRGNAKANRHDEVRNSARGSSSDSERRAKAAREDTAKRAAKARKDTDKRAKAARKGKWTVKNGKGRLINCKTAWTNEPGKRNIIDW
jgi:hypothetical protein